MFSKIVSAVICALAVQVVSGGLSDLLTLNRKPKMSPECEQLNKWLDDNVERGASPEAHLDKASAHFEASKAIMKPTELETWQAFVDIKKLTPKTMCNAETLKILRKNFDNCGLSWPEKRQLNTRVELVIYEIQLGHSKNCAKIFDMRLDRLTGPFNKEKTYLIKMVEEFEAIGSLRNKYDSEPHSHAAEVYYKNIREAKDDKVADAILKALYATETDYYNILTQKTAKFGHRAVNKEGMAKTVEDIYDSCKKLMKNVGDFMDLLIFDLHSIEQEVSIEAPEMDDIRYSWYRYHMCKSLVQRDQSKLLEAMVHHEAKRLDEVNSKLL